MLVVNKWRWYIFHLNSRWSNLEEFLNCLNYSHPNLKFTYEKSKLSVNFLDVSVSIVDNKLEVALFCKPTDRHQLFHFNSPNPFHKTKSIVCRKGMPIKRLFSSLLTSPKHVEHLKAWFCKRGYPHKVVDVQFKRVSEKVSMVYLKDLVERSRFTSCCDISSPFLQS